MHWRVGSEWGAAANAAGEQLPAENKRRREFQDLHVPPPTTDSLQETHSLDETSSYDSAKHKTARLETGHEHLHGSGRAVEPIGQRLGQQLHRAHELQGCHPRKLDEGQGGGTVDFHELVGEGEAELLGREESSVDS